MTNRATPSTTISRQPRVKRRPAKCRRKRSTIKITTSARRKRPIWTSWSLGVTARGMASNKLILYRINVPFFNHGLHQVAAKPVTQVAVIRNGEDEQVGLLARLQRAQAVGASDGGGRIDRGGDNG